MSQRTDQRTRDRTAAGADGRQERAGGRTGLRGRVVDRASRVFSTRYFLVSLAVLAVGLLVGGAIPVPVVGGLVGLFAAAFALGAASPRRRLTEVGLAGAAVAGVAAVARNLVLSLLVGFGIPFAVVGAGTGLLVAAAGAYFGNDFRNGLTRDV